MTIAELLLSKDEPTQYSTLPYATLQTRDAFLATDALINARKNGYRPLAVASTSKEPLSIGASPHRASMLFHLPH
ncbi:BZ3500_MvSof-1268-A1-R1_Chr3-1g06113 [Microbotryum saponariae]|uniref:BZ3500_MvSof-1268-A1-R1_Chr3-1g06113 protein n=1 Tax=Microbotryum saponariae TaxID=289078 RepID=A0A2X0NEZ6_9BASI|nr:BZ3500_MvSof-1268-A1-R1_Chr3-1g06113 [Microbotryum saponariae]SDA03976.1 BZ3501_MvSof-1269-A2-R1_Chr3-2g05798 [Microbotryum saponariae]